MCLRTLDGIRGLGDWVFQRGYPTPPVAAAAVSAVAPVSDYSKHTAIETAMLYKQISISAAACLQITMTPIEICSILSDTIDWSRKLLYFDC